MQAEKDRAKFKLDAFERRKAAERAECSKAASRIAAVRRGQLARRDVTTKAAVQRQAKERAAMQLRMAKMKQKKLEEEQAAARKVQCHYRAKMARRCYQGRQAAHVKERERLALEAKLKHLEDKERKMARAEGAEKDIAARNIQTMYRGKLARRQKLLMENEKARDLRSRDRELILQKLQKLQSMDQVETYSPRLELASVYDKPYESQTAGSCGAVPAEPGSRVIKHAGTCREPPTLSEPGGGGSGGKGGGRIELSSLIASDSIRAIHANMRQLRDGQQMLTPRTGAGRPTNNHANGASEGVIGISPRPTQVGAGQLPSGREEHNHQDEVTLRSGKGGMPIRDCAPRQPAGGGPKGMVGAGRMLS